MAQVSPAGVMRAVLSDDRIGVPAEPSRRGDAMWTRGDLEYRTWVGRTADGGIACHTNIGDAKFAERMGRYGRMSVMVRSANPPREWPSGRTVHDEELDDLVDDCGAQLGFLADRADLVDVLSQEGDLHRGSAYAWLPRASYPARLVQALVLARDMGLADKEKEIRGKLTGTMVLGDSGEVDIRRSAQQWAKQYGKVLGFEIPL
jgi:hypothetical protein